MIAQAAAKVDARPMFLTLDLFSKFDSLAYFNDNELLLRCSTEPPCVRDGDQLRATLPLSSRGSYQTLLLVSDRPLPEPSTGYDEDASSWLSAGGVLNRIRFAAGFAGAACCAATTLNAESGASRWCLTEASTASRARPGDTGLSRKR